MFANILTIFRTAKILRMRSVGIANDQLNVLEDIRNNTRELASIRNLLSRIESQMAIVTGE